MIDIKTVKFNQATTCKCGKILSRADVRMIGESVGIICSTCHSSVMEVELDIPEEPEWD